MVSRVAYMLCPKVGAATRDILKQPPKRMHGQCFEVHPTSRKGSATRAIYAREGVP